MFTYEDLSQVLNSGTTLQPGEFLKAWGIDEPGFRRFMEEGAATTIPEQALLSVEERSMSDMIVGFAIGFIVAQEMELRKMTKESSGPA